MGLSWIDCENRIGECCGVASKHAGKAVPAQQDACNTCVSCEKPNQLNKSHGIIGNAGDWISDTR